MFLVIPDYVERDEPEYTKIIDMGLEKNGIPEVHCVSEKTLKKFINEKVKMYGTT